MNARNGMKSSPCAARNSSEQRRQRRGSSAVDDDSVARSAHAAHVCACSQAHVFSLSLALVLALLCASCCSFLFRIRKIITKLIINCRAMQFEKIMLCTARSLPLSLPSLSFPTLPLAIGLSLSLPRCLCDCVDYLLIIALRLWPPLSAAFDLLNRKPKWLLVFVSVRFALFCVFFRLVFVSLRFEFSYFIFGFFCLFAYLRPS